MRGQHVQRPRILAYSIRLRRIDLDDVMAGAEAAEAHQVFHVLRRIEIFAGGERGCVDVCQLGEQRKIERIARLLEPAQLERRERLGIGQRFVAAELAISVDRQMIA